MGRSDKEDKEVDELGEDADEEPLVEELPSASGQAQSGILMEDKLQKRKSVIYMFQSKHLSGISILYLASLNK